ncbi:MAG: allophanate hydrolase [Proteobacteria bacterium]|nr:allophanate hydrolase [Pseudomonadota bacterium]
MENLSFDIASLHKAYKSGVLATEVIAECYRRINDQDDDGIFITLTDETAALSAAQSIGPFDPITKPLWGIPFVVKDNIDVDGAPTTAACPAYEYVAEKDAFVVARLRDAGAILIGKTNLDQFATGLVGIRSPYPPPKNAIDPNIVPGGSSSGSAVAVAKGLVSFSLGTDTAGSGRVPAALNNIVGLKPTLGALSGTGVVPACRTLDTVSIFALTVDNAYDVYKVTAVFDPEDAYARTVPTPNLINTPPCFTIGVPSPGSREFFKDTVQEVSFERTIEVIAQIGGRVREIDFAPFYDVANLLYEGAWVAERYTVVEELMAQRPDALFPVTNDIISEAKKLSAADTFRGIYKLQELKRLIEPLIEAINIICVPTIPTFYSLEDMKKDPVGPNSRLGTYTNFVNLLDLCGIAVPVAPRSDGRPGSATLLARRSEDSLVASLAALLHQQSNVTLGATNWTLPERKPLVPSTAKDEILIAAVGAHMSGLPLNAELVKLGGRFQRKAKTAPTYRLYSLNGGPPFRPGLMRDKKGQSIDLEIWSLPSHQFGTFLKGIPAPLGIGTITLDDGNEVKSFICEAIGLEGAKDITEFGGWRNFLAS